MVIESDGQLFGVPMDHVIETVRVPRSSIRTFKQSKTAVLRGRIVPLKSLNALLGIAAIPRSNSDDEIAVLLVQAGNAELGLLVDGFQETMGVIQKPFSGFLSGLSAYYIDVMLCEERRRTDEKYPDPDRKALLESHLNSYKMASQTVTHLAVAGGGSDSDYRRPAIELF